MEYLVTLKAESRETGETKTFSYPLSSAGELLNNLVLSGYHNITDMTLADIT